MASGPYDTSVPGGSSYPSADYTGYPDGTQGGKQEDLNTGMYPATYPPPERVLDYGTYGFPMEFPRSSTATDFGSGHDAAPDIATDQADQMTAYQTGPTDIFGQHTEPLKPYNFWDTDPEQPPMS
jgi:hypothetical protein